MTSTAPVYVLSLVVSSVLIQATLHISQEQSTSHGQKTWTIEYPAKTNQTNQMSLITALDNQEKRFLFGKIKWSSWAHWSACSISCGKTGVQTRRRTCLKSGAVIGKCHGSSSISRACAHHCPVPGHWSSWSAWSHCSVSCGHLGHMVRHHSCNNPPPAYGGANCNGSSSNLRSCYHHCIVPGHWSSWSAWSHCSVSCGHLGHMVRHHSCNNPPPAYGGANCYGSSSNVRSCYHHCIVDGHWGSWSSYGSCSVSCCTGSKVKKRSCNHPAPAYGGKSCAGSYKYTRACSNPCKGDATWSHWTHWSSCSASCLSGTMSRSRTCTNMTVCTGSCHGSGKETTACDQGPCPEWSSWLFTPCSVTCGTGSKQGMRRCTSGHEEDCVGSSLKTETCTESPCPVDGGWGNWNAWDACSQTCGDGIRHRRRLCDNPAPAHMGQRCHGNVTDSSTCHVVDCPSWGAYYEVGTCSVTCGDGVIQLQRDCSTDNNHDCTGSPYDEKPCLRPTC